MGCTNTTKQQTLPPHNDIDPCRVVVVFALAFVSSSFHSTARVSRSLSVRGKFDVYSVLSDLPLAFSFSAESRFARCFRRSRGD